MAADETASMANSATIDLAITFRIATVLLQLKNYLLAAPEGKRLVTIFTSELVANLDLGDSDYKTLYIAARTRIYKIRVKPPGIPGR